MQSKRRLRRHNRRQSRRQTHKQSSRQTHKQSRRQSRRKSRRKSRRQRQSRRNIRTKGFRKNKRRYKKRSLRKSQLQTGGMKRGMKRLFGRKKKPETPVMDLISAVNGNDVVVWNVNTGKVVSTLRCESSVESVQFSPNGKSIITQNTGRGGYISVRAWEVSDGRNIAVIEVSGLLFVRYSQTHTDRGLIGIYSFDQDEGQKKLVIYDETLEPVEDYPEITVDFSGLYPRRLSQSYFVDFDCYPDVCDVKYIVGLAPRCIVLDTVNGETGSEISLSPTGIGCIHGSSVKFNHRGDNILLTCDNYLVIWELQADPATGENRWEVSWTHPESRTLNYAEFSPDDNKIITACNNGGVEVWELSANPDTGESQWVCRRVLREHIRRVNYAKFISDEKFMSSSDDGNVRVWELHTVPETDEMECKCIRILKMGVSMFQFGNRFNDIDYFIDTLFPLRLQQINLLSLLTESGVSHDQCQAILSIKFDDLQRK